MKSILKMLFVDSQGSKNPITDDISDLFEDAEAMEKLEIDAKPLHAALKEIGVDRPLVSSPSGLHMEFDNEDEYNEVHHKLLDINSIHPLACAGWVATSSDNVNPTDKLPKYVINFIELKTADIGKGADTADDLETIIRQAQEWGDAHEADNEPGGGVTREDLLPASKAKATHIDEASDALVDRLVRGEPFRVDKQVPKKWKPVFENHATYGWIITENYLADDEEKKHETIGPRDISPEIAARLQSGQGQRFRMFDDDGEKMYEGRYIGPDDETMFAPKDDFGEPDGGATEIWYDGIGQL